MAARPRHPPPMRCRPVGAAIGRPPEAPAVAAHIKCATGQDRRGSFFVKKILRSSHRRLPVKPEVQRSCSQNPIPFYYGGPELSRTETERPRMLRAANDRPYRLYVDRSTTSSVIRLAGDGGCHLLSVGYHFRSTASQMVIKLKTILWIVLPSRGRLWRTAECRPYIP